jgi:light-harvesting complex II chlorophyll a/b binding protein 4
MATPYEVASNADETPLNVSEVTHEATNRGLLAGTFAAAAAVVFGFLMKFSGRPQKSEQLAMAAAFGKKAAPKAPTKVQPRELWYPTAEPPSWLDGSMPGDRGFDPLGLAKPNEYLQFDLDGLDQNAGKNPAGSVIGAIAGQTEVSTDSLQPYSNVFSIDRFRECELIHGRWAMMAVLGCLVSEAVTGVAWNQAGLVEVQNGASYWGFNLPFSNSQIVIFEVLAMAGVEIFRNTELDVEKRCYPGGAFDPLGLASKDEATAFRLKEAELKHSRLAMLAFLGFAIQAGKTGLGASESFSVWAANTWQ